MSGDGTTTVLVVDDDIDVADTYATHLRDRFEVETAYSGTAALEALSLSTDVVLLDRRMPGISGDEVLRTIRERSLEARVAMVTGVDPDFDIIDMPFDDYVSKPVTRAELVETVERLRRCTDYRESIRVYYALTAKYAALEVSKSDAELEDSDEFAALKTDIRDVRSQIDEMTATFDDEDFQALFKDIGIRGLSDTNSL